LLVIARIAGAFALACLAKSANNAAVLQTFNRAPFTSLTRHSATHRFNGDRASDEI
jgi:hypothetical protein